MRSLFLTPFKLDRLELLCSAASSVIQTALTKICDTALISDICEKPQYGYTEKATFQNVGPRFVRITDIKSGTIDWHSVPYCMCDKPAPYLLHRGDILIGRTGSVGKTFFVDYVPEEAVYASYLIRLRTKADVTSKYLYWCLNSSSLWDQLLSFSRGSAIKNINGKMISSLRFPIPENKIQHSVSTFLFSFRAYLMGLEKEIPELPHPLSEQRRIVTKIERLATKIEEAKGLRKKSGLATHIFLDAALVKIFEGQLDKTWVDGCLGDFVIDDCYGTSEKTHDEPIGVPILRMGNIQNGALDVKNLKYLQISDKDTQKWILHAGDILVNRTNSSELVGKCAVFNLEGEWGFASYIIRLRLDTKKANPYLVAKYINSSLGREYMLREKKQMTGQANVNAKKLKALPIKLPSVHHQKMIVEYLNSLQAKVDGLKSVQSKTTAELDALLPSILDKAFRGEL